MVDITALPIDLDERRIDGRFRLVNIVAQRAKELAQDGKPKISSKAKKVTTLALEEALAGKLEFITGEEAREANEEARKLDYKRYLEEKRRETEQEDLSELEKDLKFYLDEREGGTDKNAIEKLFAEPEEGLEAGVETGIETEAGAETEIEIEIETETEIEEE